MTRKISKINSYIESLKREELAAKRANSHKDLYRKSPTLANRKKYVKSLQDLREIVLSTL